VGGAIRGLLERCCKLPDLEAVAVDPENHHELSNPHEVR
jgi:hypothetical protein